MLPSLVQIDNSNLLKFNCLHRQYPHVRIFQYHSTSLGNHVSRVFLLANMTTVLLFSLSFLADNQPNEAKYLLAGNNLSTLCNMNASQSSR